MTDLFAELAGLDRLVHEPARLAILTALSSCQSADFNSLKRLIGLSSGNLSAHLTKLEEAGLIEVKKQFVHRRPNTLVTISAQGREAVDAHWRRLADLRAGTSEWEP